MPFILEGVSASGKKRNLGQWVNFLSENPIYLKFKIHSEQNSANNYEQDAIELYFFKYFSRSYLNSIYNSHKSGDISEHFSLSKKNLCS